jgi:hypothetical protein
VLGILLEVLNMFVIYLHLIIVDYVFPITVLFFRFSIAELLEIIELRQIRFRTFDDDRIIIRKILLKRSNLLALYFSLFVILYLYKY